MTWKEAYEKVKEYDGNVKAIGCTDYGDRYSFALVPKDYNYDPDDPFSFSTMSVFVDKQSGKITEYNWFHLEKAEREELTKRARTTIGQEIINKEA